MSVKHRSAPARALAKPEHRQRVIPDKRRTSLAAGDTIREVLASDFTDIERRVYESATPAQRRAWREGHWGSGAKR